MIDSLTLHQLFDFRIDKEHTQDAPSFHPLTKDKFINLAIDTFVKTRYPKTDITEKNREDIQNFITQQSFTPVVVSDTLLEYDLALLEPKHWYTIKMLAVIDKECENNHVLIKPEKHDNVFHNLNNPFKKPKINKCFYTIQENKKIQIYKSLDAVYNEIVIWYIKQFTPCNIVTNSITEVTEQIKEDIIALAVQYAIEHTLNPRIQTFPPLNITYQG